MKRWLRRRAAVAGFVFALVSMSAMAITDGSVAVSWAQGYCPGAGWYWDYYTNACQPRPGPNVTACFAAGGRRGYMRGGVCVGN